MKDKKRSLEMLSLRTVTLLIGLLCCIAVFSASAKTDMDNAKKHLSDIVKYVSNQCVTYNITNVASETRSLMRIMESVQQIDRNLSHDRQMPHDALLAQYADALYLTGILYLTPDGRVEAKSGDSNVAEMEEFLQQESILNVAAHPEKNYAVRINMPDGSYLDLAATGLTDYPGLVVAYYRTSKQYNDAYTLSFQGILEGYNLSSDGVVAIAKGNIIAASNDDTLIGQNVMEVGVLKGIADSGEEKLCRIKPDEKNWHYYYGMLSRGRDYYVYAYMPESEVFQITPRNVLIALTLYAILILLARVIHWKSVQRYQKEQMEQEKIYQEKLIEEAEKAEHANRSKTIFLQRMSHDIRTPINGILGLVEIGDHYAQDMQKQAECRRKIHNSGRLLLDLVNEVLDMGKMESGEVFLEEVPFSLPKLLEEVTDSFYRSAAEHSIVLHKEVLELPHPKLIGSPLHLKRLLMNIQGNAVKYNRENGEIWVKCREIRCEGQTAWIEFQCADNGIGMGEEFQKHIFEPFAQEKIHARASYGGTGLGMSISKSLVDAMGGTICFDSKQGVGTTFYITIPFRICDAPQAAEAQQSQEPQEAQAAISLSGMRLLLAEDNELNMEVAAFLLENSGAIVTKAWNGKEALDIFAASPRDSFDVILMDVMMPVMDGYEAAAAIRELPRVDAQTTAIIAMTANAFAEDRQKAYESGMNEHLAKPIDKEELLRTIAKYRRTERNETES